MKNSESKPKRGPLQSILTGGLVGGLEICITYPTEYVKTQLQLDQRSATPKFTGISDCVKKTISQYGFKGLYKGIAPLLAGSVPKCAVRFSAYEQATQLFKDENNKISQGKKFLAGLLAGASEAVLAVCPMETVKVKFVHDQSLAEPKFKGFLHGLRKIIKNEGIGGIYKGVAPTVLKQASNQGIRFLVYDNVKNYLCKFEMNSIATNAISGLIAGACSVYGNTPIDVVKTRMQGLEANLYKSSLDCFLTIIKTEGLTALYKGTVPRLCRVCLDSAIVFTLYDEISKCMDRFFIKENIQPPFETRKPVL
jgi:solute carrier family 25 citrate transporter 1